MKLGIYLIVLLNKICIGDTSHNETYHLFLGTKTPYRTVSNKDRSVITYKACEPLKIWMLIRHGTRLPTANLINKMSDRLSVIRDHILAERLQRSELDTFEKWKFKIDASQEKILAHEGEDEMQELAERMQARFPMVLPSVYSNTTYQFRYTATQRTRESAVHFAKGLFGIKTSRDVWYPEPMKRDPVLRFYKLCNKWRNSVKRNPASLEEMNKFYESSHMKKAVEGIGSKLNLLHVLNKEDVHLMYTTCGFETAWNKLKKSPWCTAFDNYTLKVMEYSEDLKYYWVDGYGYALNYQQACVAFKNMIKFFERNPHEKAALYFTHSGTLLKMLAHLGLYREAVPLTHGDFENSGDRKWRVSKIDPFGTNLAVVLHDCGGIKKVLVLHQEHIVRLPSCPDEDLCSIEDVLMYYKESVENCTFSEMCS